MNFVRFDSAADHVIWKQITFSVTIDLKIFYFSLHKFPGLNFQSLGLYNSPSILLVYLPGLIRHKADLGGNVFHFACALAT